jgi:hypothetical protein
MPLAPTHVYGGAFLGEERIVQTFPSGLVSVQQSYFCPNSQVAALRATLAAGQPWPDTNTAPAVDGLTIFPDPQESATAGFTEFKLTGYGRTVESVVRSSALKQIPIFWQLATTSDPYAPYATISGKWWTVSGSIVVPSQSNFNYDELGIEMPKPFDFRCSLLPDYTNSSVQYLGQIGDQILDAVNLSNIGFGSVSYIRENPVHRYLVKFADADGVNQYKAEIRLAQPKPVISTSRNFGAWDEIEFETEKGKLPGQVSLVPI